VKPISKSSFLYQATNHDLEEGCFTKLNMKSPLLCHLERLREGLENATQGAVWCR